MLSFIGFFVAAVLTLIPLIILADYYHKLIKGAAYKLFSAIGVSSDKITGYVTIAVRGTHAFLILSAVLFGFFWEGHWFILVLLAQFVLGIFIAAEDGYGRGKDTDDDTDDAVVDALIEKRKYVKAKKALENLRTEGEGKENSLLSYLNACWANKDYDKAVEAFESRSNKSTPDFSEQLMMGKIYAEMGNWEKASVFFEFAAKLSDLGKYELDKIAREYCENSTPEKAIRIYNVILRFNPSSSKAYAGLAKAKTQMGDFEGSLFDIHASMEIKPDNGDAVAALNHYHIEKKKEMEGRSLFITVEDFQSDEVSPDQLIANAQARMKG